jgi:hypothetical protein
MLSLYWWQYTIEWVYPFFSLKVISSITYDVVTWLCLIAFELSHAILVHFLSRRPSWDYSNPPFRAITDTSLTGKHYSSCSGYSQYSLLGFVADVKLSVAYIIFQVLQTHSVLTCSHGQDYTKILPQIIDLCSHVLTWLYSSSTLTRCHDSPGTS